MKVSSTVLPLALITLLTSVAVPTGLGTVVTFDDLPLNTGTASLVASNYHGLTWSYFGAVNAVLNTNVVGLSGYYYGMVSASNVAFNGSGLPVEIDSPGTNFNFGTVYLTGAWNSNLNIEVQGLSGTNLLYDQTVVASATYPTLFTFNYLNIDRLYFNSFGGQNAGFSTAFSGENFVMDNFTFDFVPEPSAFLLTAAGALMLWSVMKRKRG